MSAALALAPCARCNGALEHGDFRCPVCGLTAPFEAQVPEELQVKVVRCDSCGAAMDFVAEARAPKCAYCGSVTHLETPADPPEQAEGYVPFTVTPDAARAALTAFLSRKAFFRPSDLAHGARLDSLVATFWPAWIFSAGAQVSWTADSDAGSRRADWAPHAGQCSLEFSEVLVSASRGLTADECEQLTPYELAGASPDPVGPEGAQVERFDASRSGARAAVMSALAAKARARVKEQHVPGARHRNVKVALRLERLTTRRLGLPAYVLAYRYREKLYRVVVHGQSAQKVIGRAPYSVLKVALVVGGGLLAVALLLALLAAL
jgi:hypothetical protein